MRRYKNTEISNYTDKASFDTTIYDKVPEKDTDEYFIAQEGDRCDNLANQFYGDSTLWWFIARVNNLQTMNIPAGTSLRIPISIENAKGF
tara:strand:+ start:534 stop:803 length:270 start_codon:yes stop_codon:yes gene_type:complete